MASTYSNIGFELMATGENANTWGTKTNTNWSIVDEALYEIYTITSSSTTQTIAAPTDATAAQSTRYSTLRYTGSPSGAVTVTLPASVKKVYNVINSTSQGITFRGTSGTTVTAVINANSSGMIHSDGASSVYLVSSDTASKLAYSGSTKLEAVSAGVDVTGNVTIIKAANVSDGDTLGSLDFKSTDDSGSDAQEVCAGIAAVAEADFTSAVNKAKLSFKTGASEAATEKMKLTDAGILSIPADGSTTTNAITLGAGDDLKLYHTGSHSVINDSGTGNLQLAGSQVDIMGGTDLGETMATFVDDGAVTLYYDNSAKFATATGGVAVTGALTATGNITAYHSSDKRLKENITNISSPLEKIQKINGVSFDWSEEHMKSQGDVDPMFSRKQDVGVIAQEVEEVLPEIVADRPDGYKAVRYEKLVPLLIEAIKEQQKQIEELKQTKIDR